jgi:hypothetical protein
MTFRQLGNVLSYVAALGFPPIAVAQFSIARQLRALRAALEPAGDNDHDASR